MAAILGNALSPLLFTIGISMTTATYASLILMTGPLWTAVLERVAFGTPVGSIQAIGMGIAFAGALYLGTGGTLEGAEAGMLLGGLLMTTANATWAGYILLTKPILSRRPPLAVMSSTNLVALPFVWPLIGLLGDVGELGGAQTWSWETWLGIIYLIVVAGVLSQVLFMYALRAVSASQAMAFTYLMPVFTAFFAAIFLDERVTLATLVCGTLIVFGLWLVNKTKPRPPHREPPEALAAAKDG
jgi:drug/metabolite transporter (DMT)-like permease